MNAYPQGRRSRSLAVIAILSLMLALGGMLASSLGSAPVPLGNVARILLDKLPGLYLAPAWSASEEAIIVQIRLPRVFTAMAVGAALATAGVIFQGLLRNPMADPYIIGTSGGAAFGATLALLTLAHLRILWFGFTLVSLCAFAGAMLAVLIVYNIARVGQRTPITTLLLSGFALSSMLAALMSFIMVLSQSSLRRIVFWTMGGLSASTWPQIRIAGPIILASIFLSYLFATDLNAFLLGDEQAAALGVEVEERKFLLLMLGSLLTGAAVSISGLVGFVGLVTPHIVRLLLGPDHRLLLPASALVGGLFLLLSDLLARLIMAPAEIPVGIITAMVGAPFFIYLLRRSKKEYIF